MESIGDVGSWFCNCVVSSDRKFEKFPLRLDSAEVPTCEIELPVDDVPLKALLAEAAEILPDMKKLRFGDQAVMLTPVRGVSAAAATFALAASTVAADRRAVE